MAIGLNSFFGVIGQFKTELDLSWHEVLEEVTILTMEMMLADRPRMVKKSEMVKLVKKEDLREHRKKYKDAWKT